ncbi:head-tail joining protein [Sansalvadorimonas verongulae]|uniref:head-tail joining protein n=1 Tax=Sansalvadorimonas verongulae TaxID=2172824 RepID=UPI0012BD3E8A|nr:hypothetical protein [Sansalvadorimonas verongulae]MTI13359.1 hypothetical protein [Sansalvadorimonas verongulae]
MDFGQLASGMHRAILSSPLAEPATVAGVPTRVIFFGEYLEADPSTGAPVASTDPKIAVSLSDFTTAPDQDDPVVIRGLRYLVDEVRPDGEGMAELMLKRDY